MAVNQPRTLEHTPRSRLNDQHNTLIHLNEALKHRKRRFGRAAAQKRVASGAKKTPVWLRVWMFPASDQHTCSCRSSS